MKILAAGDNEKSRAFFQASSTKEVNK